ncbi:MAG TPA: oxygen-independent coproporphyrinogen III oxidase [Acetobacteraceae bacterium]|nr:oxygen-independent coproporphyrinogen III oxidase [Acetobacteraceae bacterium]
MDIHALIAKYDTPVPRYTSYPTAPHFSPDVGAATYAEWLRALPAAPLSLYLHVPFCARLCWFCGCHTTAVHSQAPLETYADVLLAEIELVAKTIGRRVPVAHVHWGGGTPTALPPARLIEIMQRLRSRFAFTEEAEIAVEVDPRTAGEDALDALGAIGCTRASLGVQDFDERVQDAVNRHQSFEVTRECALALRRRGIWSMNLDLMYGLPYQTEASVAATVDQALDLRPDRIAMFGYAHVPWMKKQQMMLPEEHLPGGLERWKQFFAAERVITRRGWRAIGLDHYALPEDDLAVAAEHGSMHRNFQGYTTDDAPALLGLGASSIGSLPQGYVQNAAPIPEYRDRIRAGELATRRGIALSRDDRLRREVIEHLMCQGEVNLGSVAADRGVDPSILRASGGTALALLAQDGLITWDGTTVRMRPEARPLVRTVAAVFDAYFKPQAGRHARAV